MPGPRVHPVRTVNLPTPSPSRSPRGKIQSPSFSLLRSGGACSSCRRLFRAPAGLATPPPASVRRKRRVGGRAGTGGSQVGAKQLQQVQTRAGPEGGWWVWGTEPRGGAGRAGGGARGTRLPQRPGWEGAAARRARGRAACAARRPAVGALVAQHVLAAPKALAALPAGEGPRARVCLAVAHQVLAPVEGLAALAAGVRLLAGGQRAQGRPEAPGVRAAVAPQVLLAPEGLAALGAGVRLLARVALPVAQRVRRLQGGLAALGAGRGARGRQEGGRRGRGAAGLLLVGARGLVRCGRHLSPGGRVSCRAKARSQGCGARNGGRRGRKGRVRAGGEC